MGTKKSWVAWGTLAIGPAFGQGNTSIKCLSAYVVQKQNKIQEENNGRS